MMRINRRIYERVFFTKHRGVFVYLCYLIVIALGYVIFNHYQSFLIFGIVILWPLTAILLYHIFLKDFEVKYPILRKGLDLVISTFILIFFLECLSHMFLI